MNTTTDTHGTPPAYWFGVIEHNLRASMRDELAELGLRRGSWRILHTLADGPAGVEEIEASLPPRGQRRGRTSGGRRGHGFGNGYGYGRGSSRDRRAFFAAKREQFGHPPFSSDEEREAFFAERRREHGVPPFAEGDERGPAPFASAEERHAFFAGMHAAGFIHGGRPWGHHPERGGFRGHDGDHGDVGHEGHFVHDEHGEHEGHRGHHHDRGQGRRFGDRDRDHGHGHGHGRAGRVASTLDTFAAQGWVTVTDGVAELTPEGRAAHDAAFERIRAVRGSVADGISDEDYATTMATLEAMARNLGWTDTNDANVNDANTHDAADTNPPAPEA